MKFSRLLICGFLLTGLLHAQSEKVLIQQLQRDVAQVDEKLRKFIDAQDQKNAELEALLKQVLDANAKQGANFGALQQSLTVAIAEQQNKLVPSINELGNKVDQLSRSLSGIETSLDALNRRVAAQDSKLSEILNNVKTINAAQQPPPPGPAATQGASSTPTPGASADVAFQAAYRDLLAGSNSLAMDEFTSFIAHFPTSESAPKAQYYMGVIYDRGEQYEDAVKAYDAVLERYPENPATRDARFAKAVALMKLDRKVEAKKEFTAFLAKYANDDNAARARQYLNELNGQAHPPAGKQKGRR